MPPNRTQMGAGAGLPHQGRQAPLVSGVWVEERGSERAGGAAPQWEAAIEAVTLVERLASSLGLSGELRIGSFSIYGRMPCTRSRCVFASIGKLEFAGQTASSHPHSSRNPLPGDPGTASSR